MWFGPHEVWRATRTADGPATQHLRQSGEEIVVRAWGPGAERLIEDAPVLL